MELLRLIVVVVSVTSTVGTLRLARALGNHMVFQRHRDWRVWGWGGEPRTVVHVTLSGTSITANSTVDATGGWFATLTPPTTMGPFTVVVQPGNLQLHDVMFGDVYVCGGQSNMQFAVPGVFNASKEIADSNYPLMRVFSVGQNKSCNTQQHPLDDLLSTEQVWIPASPKSVGGPGWGSYFSAVCWFFGKNVFKNTLKEKVPLGLISSNWGGTYAPSWIAHPEQCGTPVPKSNPPNVPSVLYNCMIAPLKHFSIAGIVWDQAESDLIIDTHPPTGTTAWGYYECIQPALIHNWRSTFTESSSAPFFFVQLQPYTEGGPYGLNLGAMRIAQTSVLNLTNTCFGTMVDLGDPTSPYGNIHPRYKQEIGERLWRCASHYVYGDNQTTYVNPTVSSAHRLPNGAVELHFIPHSLPGGKLVQRSASCPVTPLSECDSWWGMSGKGWTPLHTPTISSGGNTLVLPTVPTDITAVGYGLNDWPLSHFHSMEGLPVVPFVMPITKLNVVQYHPDSHLTSTIQSLHVNVNHLWWALDPTYYVGTLP